MTELGAIATAVCSVALLVAAYRESTVAEWVFKPLAATGFVVVAIGAGAAHTPYGRALLVALALCWLGDVLLIPKARAVFVAGLGAFLCGHVAFAAAFLIRGVDHRAVSIALVPLVVAGVGVDRWLRPHLGRTMRIAVRAYLTAIVFMGATAIGAFAAGGPWHIVVGALGFMASDIAVARNRFVAPGFVNRLWGSPLYFASQVVLAWSAAAS